MARRLPRRRVVVLVVDLDPGQAPARQLGEPASSRRGPLRAPRVGDHGHPPGLR